MSVVAAVAALALGSAPASQSVLDPSLVTWRTYDEGVYSKAEEQRIVEISNLAEYQRYLNQCGPQQAHDGRDVEWGREELVAIHVGSRSTGGYSVQVTRIAKTKPTETTVFWREVTPPKGLATTEATTSPWVIVRLNRTGTHLAFSGSKNTGLPGGIQVIGYDGWRSCHCCSECVRKQRNRLPWAVFAAGDDAPLVVGNTKVMSWPSDYDSYRRNFNMPGLGSADDVDWSRERLLAIHLGRTITPGYRIEVNHVDIVDSMRTDVTYTELQPAGVLLGTPGSGPYLIIRVPRVGSIVTFTKRVEKDSPFRRTGCSCGCGSCDSCGD